MLPSSLQYSSIFSFPLLSSFLLPSFFPSLFSSLPPSLPLLLLTFLPPPYPKLTLSLSSSLPQSLLSSLPPFLFVSVSVSSPCSWVGKLLHARLFETIESKSKTEQQFTKWEIWKSIVIEKQKSWILLRQHASRHLWQNSNVLQYCDSHKVGSSRVLAFYFTFIFKQLIGVLFLATALLMR